MTCGNFCFFLLFLAVETSFCFSIKFIQHQHWLACVWVGLKTVLLTQIRRLITKYMCIAYMLYTHDIFAMLHVCLLVFIWLDLPCFIFFFLLSCHSFFILILFFLEVLVRKTIFFCLFLECSLLSIGFQFKTLLCAWGFLCFFFF